jgi:hypothetical protein
MGVAGFRDISSKKVEHVWTTCHQYTMTMARHVTRAYSARTGREGATLGKLLEASICDLLHT